MHTYKPIELGDLKTYPLAERKSLVNADSFAAPWQPGGTFVDFLDRLPHILAVRDLTAVISAVADAARRSKTVILGMGAHVIKVGLAPVIIDLMERGIVSMVAMNGAGIIHEFELAAAGCTSEDVSASLADGSFGMARETGRFLCDAIDRAATDQIGLGQAVGRAMLDSRLPFCAHSILAAGARLNIPVTVHVAIGTDIIHMHPDFDAGRAGQATHLDFRMFAKGVATLEKGVYLNVGSAVILPEIFLKATTLARNLGYAVNNFTTVNMDFIRHYRPMTNVVNRPTAGGGRGYNLVGHHEIMLPLLAAGVIESLNRCPDENHPDRLHSSRE